MQILYVAFKGNGNSANKIVRSLSGDQLFLTNSYHGLKRDIDHINHTYDFVYLFGLDKSLRGNVRIDSIAKKDGICLSSEMDFDSLAMKLNKSGIITNVGNTPTQSLCNEAYWHMLKKFNCHAVFFHVPSIKYITENFIEKIKTVLEIEMA